MWRKYELVLLGVGSIKRRNLFIYLFAIGSKRVNLIQEKN